MTHVQYKEKPMAEASNEIVTVQSPYMTKEEIAIYFRCSISSINRKVKLGLLKTTKAPGGRRVLFDKKENRIKE